MCVTKYGRVSLGVRGQRKTEPRPNRSYSRYSPSLHALKDWWDKNNVTWFLRRQTSDTICQCKKSPSSLFILANRKWRAFYLKANYRWKWSLLLLLLLTEDVLTSSYNDVLKSCRNSKRIFCMTIKSSSLLERINKLQRDYSYWQILSLVCPLKYHVTLLYSCQP